MNIRGGIPHFCRSIRASLHVAHRGCQGLPTITLTRLVQAGKQGLLHTAERDSVEARLARLESLRAAASAPAPAAARAARKTKATK